MTRPRKSSAYLTCLALIAMLTPVQAIEIIHFVEAKDHARIMGKVNGLKMADDGTVYLTSTEQGSLLRIRDGAIEAYHLSPSVFLDADTRTMIAAGDPNQLLAECEDPKVQRFLRRGAGDVDASAGTG